MKLIPTIGFNYKTQIVSWIQIYKEKQYVCKNQSYLFYVLIYIINCKES